MTWEKKSTRRDGLPSWWPVTVRRIKARDPKCRCPKCPKCINMGEGGPCMRSTTDVDHIGDRNDHSDKNLRGLCSPCHNHRTSRQGNAAKAERRQPSGFHTPKHPGDLTCP